MALPVEIVTRTVTYGPETDFQGNSVTGTLTFTPSEPITWVASGQGLHVKPISVNLNSSGSGSIDLICTDQTGFRNAAGQNITNWWYTVTAELVGVASSTRKFIVPTGVGSLDLDTMIPITTGSTTISVPVIVNSVAGRTGAVTLTKNDVGLSNADNTADASKPVSVAQAAAIALAASVSIWAEHPSFASVQAALDSATPGSTVWFTQSHTLSGGAVYTVPTGVTLRCTSGVTITQTVWAKPVFDCLNADNVTIDGFRLVCSGTRGDILSLSSFRGDAGYGYGAGVWTNSNGGSFRNLDITGFTEGINFSAFDSTSGTQSVVKNNNSAHNIRVDTVDFGVLYFGQNNLSVNNLSGHNIVQSTNGGPPHVMYGSGFTTLYSTNVQVDNLQADGCPLASAFQFKYTDGLTVGTMQAINSLAALTLLDVANVCIDTCELSSPTAATVPSVMVDITSPTAGATHDIYIGRIQVKQGASTAANSKKVVGIVGDRVTIGSIQFTSTITDVDSAVSPLVLQGSDIIIGSITQYVPAGNFKNRMIQVSGLSDRVAIRNIKTNGSTRLVSVDATATNVTIDYNPADITGLVGQVVAAINGTTIGYTANIKPFERSWVISGGVLGATQKAEPFLSTWTHYSITDASTYVVPVPGLGAFVGMRHEIAIENQTAGALGSVTFNAVFVFSVAFVKPPAGGVTSTCFRWNGTNWVQVVRG